MEPINVRYGESLTLAVSADDPTATTATLYVGNPGENPVITKSASLIAGAGSIELTPDDTSVPLGDYKYQINVAYPDPDKLDKYPEADDCSDDGLPDFIVHEALDSTEVVS